MRKLVLLLVGMVVFSAVAHAAGGGGGPMYAMYMVDFSVLNTALESEGIEFTDNYLQTWGGAGTNYLTEGFGIGGLAIGGFRASTDRSAMLYLVQGGLMIHNIIMEGKVSQMSIMFGPGITTLRLVRGTGAERSEYSVGGMTFFGAFAVQLKISEVWRLEANAGFSFVSGDEWTELPGSYALASTPPKMDISGLYAGLILRFGGTYSSTAGSAGVYVPTGSTLH